MTRGWIVGYTLWDWVFIYSNYPSIAGQHLGVFGVSLVVGLFQPERWIQVRTYTLATWFLLASAILGSLVTTLVAAI